MKKNEKTVFSISLSPCTHIWRSNTVLGVKCSHDHSMNFWIGQPYNKNILNKENGEQKMPTTIKYIFFFFVTKNWFILKAIC